MNFDLIVSQFNLEHIIDVQAFVSKIHFALNSNGLFILQVPDISDFVRNKMPNFLAHEHIQYFTKDSLSKLLESQGFKNILWGEEGPSLIVAAAGNKERKRLETLLIPLVIWLASKNRRPTRRAT